MKTLLYLLFLSLSLSAIKPERTVILYNSDSPDSLSIAKHYQQRRGIPLTHMIGLSMPQENAITIQGYEEYIKAPLSTIFTDKKLWTKDSKGLVTFSKIDLIVSIFGVPFKTTSSLLPPGIDTEGNALPERVRPMTQADGASVDSELALLAHNTYPLVGQARNNYFKQTGNFNANTHGLLLVGRIDGPSPAHCMRMIDDALEVEREGLYGFCYLDKAYKGGGYTMGDQWLETIAQENKKIGAPTVIEETSDVYVTNYPMHDAALYYGWYSHHFSGPFRNPQMKFKKGSIITHIHSYSAKNLRNSTSHWVGPIIDKGAAATLGNVHEPFLHLTTHLDLFHNSLLSGKTLVESAWSATPALSWHNVVIGDPLYRPFKNKPKLDESPLKILRELAPITTNTKFKKLLSHVEKKPSSQLHEAIGLIYTSLKAHEKCLAHFRQAEELALTDEHKMRNLLHQIAYHRKQGQVEKALLLVKANLLTYREKPSGLPLLAINNILDPPPPPPVEHPDTNKK